MYKYYQIIKKSIVNSITQAPISAEEKTRLQHYTIFLLAGVPTMLIYGIYNLIIKDYFLFTLIILSAFGLIVGWKILNQIKNSKIVYRINAILFSILIFYMLFIGGESGSKSLWMYTFPLIAFFLFGKNEGIFWSVLAIIVAALFLVNPWEFSILYAYPNEFKIRFMTSYTIVTAVTYWFEYFRYKYRKDLEIKNNKLQKALNEVKTLSGFLPICASCKKIRDDKGYWNQLEGYIQNHSNAEFSHSICPECTTKLYPDL